MYWKLYREQKEYVKQLVYKEKTKHENIIVEQIKNCKDSGKKMWEQIRKLKGENSKERKVNLYSEFGEIVDEEKIAGNMIDYCANIYKNKENSIPDRLSDSDRLNYKKIIQLDVENKDKLKIIYDNVSEYQKIPSHLEEHMDMCKGTVTNKDEQFKVIFNRGERTGIPNSIAQTYGLAQRKY